MTYTTVTTCGNDHQEWVKSLDFYKGEIDILKKRLLEVAAKNSHHDVMAWVEHFQNQFVVQRNNIDELKHAINEHAGKVSGDAQKHEGKMESSLVSEHGHLKVQVKDFEKVVNELRVEFNLFLAKMM